MDRFPNVDLAMISNTYLLIPSCIPLRSLSLFFSLILQASLPRVEMEFLECRSHRYPEKVEPNSRDILTGVRNRGCCWGTWTDECFSRKDSPADRTRAIQQRKVQFLPNTPANKSFFPLGMRQNWADLKLLSLPPNFLISPYTKQDINQ